MLEVRNGIKELNNIRKIRVLKIAQFTQIWQMLEEKALMQKTNYNWQGDGGPSLSTLFGPTKAKGKLQDVIAGALEEDQGRGPRTVERTVVQLSLIHI